MRSEFIDLIEELEGKAKTQLDQARGEAEEIRDQAHHEAQQIVRQARDETRRVRIRQAEEPAGTEGPETAGDEEAAAVYKEASARQQEAVAAILKALEG